MAEKKSRKYDRRKIPEGEKDLWNETRRNREYWESIGLEVHDLYELNYKHFLCVKVIQAANNLTKRK